MKRKILNCLRALARVFKIWRNELSALQKLQTSGKEVSKWLLININALVLQLSKGPPKSKHAFDEIMLSHKDCGNIMKNGG